MKSTETANSAVGLSGLPVSTQRKHRFARWLATAGAYDLGLYRHSLLVVELTLKFAAHLGFTVDDQNRLANAALLHDVGKLHISREILRKPAFLTSAEMKEIKLHPELGYRLLLKEGGYSEEILTIVRDHHERLDGTGYPNGLTASSIGEAVRIVTLAISMLQ